MKTYRISPSGRRTAIILLIGALIIWIFAVWTFGTTLGISYNPIAFWESLRNSVEQGLSISQIVPALLMLVLIIATPLVIWNILEEWSATYTPTDNGLQFSSLGVHITYPWSGIAAIRHIDEDSDESADELVFTDNYTGQVRNPVLRFLHIQAYGRMKLPIYAGVLNRAELLADIRQYAELLHAPTDAATATEVTGAAS